MLRRSNRGRACSLPFSLDQSARLQQLSLLVNTAVALQAILGDDFSVQLDGRPQDPDQLLQQAEVAQLQGLPQGPVCFHVCVRLTIPERGLTLQVTILC